MLLPSLLKSGDQVYQKVIKQLYQKMLLLNLLITLLLEEGRIARHFHYVESGMLRQYYYKNGHDITEHFSCEDDLVFCIISLFRQEPTRLMIEAIEPTVVYDIPYTGLQELFVSYSSIAQLYKKILEWGLMVSQNKADSWRFETAKERYKRFLKDFPEAAKRAPISHIASYLLMTPETLRFYCICTQGGNRTRTSVEDTGF